MNGVLPARIALIRNCWSAPPPTGPTARPWSAATPSTTAATRPRCARRRDACDRRCRRRARGHPAGNSDLACVLTLALQMAGCQHVPLNPLYTARELDFILRDAQPALLIADEASSALAAPLAAARHPPARWRGGARLDDSIRRNAGGAPPATRTRRRCNTPAAPPASQGRHPEPGRHRHQCVPARSRAATRHGAETVLCAMPLFHSYGMAMGLFLAASAAATLVVLPRYRPDDVFDAVARRVTLFPGSPTIYAGLMAHARFAQTDWSSVRVCYSGSAPLAEETLRRWEAAVGAPIYEGYGQTEAGPILTYNGRKAAAPARWAGPCPAPRSKSWTWRPARNLLAGQRGEIRARPADHARLSGAPEATAESLRDGWLYTGDIGEFAEDGFLYIRDRKKDLVIVGGYNVYPREVDEVLYLHADVAQAAAVGWPDSYRGEVIRAFVVLRPDASADEAALLAHCQANLARYKVPAVIEILDALPCTSANKVDKKALRARADSASGATPGLRHVLARDLGRHPRQLARPADLRVGRHALDRKAPGQAAHQRAIVRQQNGHGHAAQPRAICSWLMA